MTYKEKIWERILSEKRKVFITKDFADIAEHETVRSALNRWVKAGKLMRVNKGLYFRQIYLPKYRKYSLPGSDQVAAALARKHNWRIAPSENLALNILGLCTQVPAKYIFISTGPYITHRYGHKELIFKHRSPAAISDIHPVTTLVIQALKGLGKGKVTPLHIAKLRNKLTDEQKTLLWKESNYAYGWMLKEIRQICEGFTGEALRSETRDQTISQQIWERLLQDKHKVYIVKDFGDIAEHNTVRSVLNRFVKAGKLMRVNKGLFYRQVYLPKFRQYSLPGSDEVALAIARKHNWRIAPSENLALNILGLCTQVPAKYIFISTGPYVTHPFWSTHLIFKHRSPAAISDIHPVTTLVIQALKGLGKGNVTPLHIAKLRRKLTKEQRQILWKESSYAYAWMHKVIRAVCEDVIETEPIDEDIGD